MAIRIIRKPDPDIELPVLLAGWPGMGNVGVMAVNYIRRQLHAVKFAEIDISRYTLPDAVQVKDGLAFLPPSPVCRIYYTRDPAAVYFVGEAQLSGFAASEVISELLDFSEHLGVRKIFTGAAFANNLSSREPSRVYGASNSRDLSEFIGKQGVKMMPEGHIAGMNGTLIGFAGNRGIDAACLLATMPIYAVSIPNPKASLALIEVCSRILNTEIDTESIEAKSREMENNMVVIEEKIRDIFPVVLSEQEKESISIEDDKIPAYIIDKIERLFAVAQKDRSQADILKRELDRWSLYEDYEDRFLNLFREE